MLDYGAHAPDISLISVDGKPRQLAEAWQDGPAILVFLRHFGCMFCKQHVVDLRAKQAEFDALGVSVTLVTQGSPELARVFIEKYRLPFATFCDEDRVAYAAYGIGNVSPNAVLRPSLYLAATRAIASGHVQTRAQGAPAQMPGLFVVGQDGVIRYAHQFGHAGDHPSTAWLLRLLPDLLPEWAAGRPAHQEGSIRGAAPHD